MLLSKKVKTHKNNKNCKKYEFFSIKYFSLPIFNCKLYNKNIFEKLLEIMSVESRLSNGSLPFK